MSVAAATPAPRPAGAPETRTAGGPRLLVLVRPGDALGFELAGAELVAVEPGGEVAALRRLLADPRAGVLAVEEGILAAVPAPLLQRARSRGLPMVLPFALPARLGGDGRGRAYVTALIRRAVGYGVKLGGAAGPGGKP
jgi:V/A-type H+-transporting ATPase subunit F